jgi:hypothetical protein
MLLVKLVPHQVYSHFQCMLIVSHNTSDTAALCAQECVQTGIMYATYGQALAKGAYICVAATHDMNDGVLTCLCREILSAFPSPEIPARKIGSD